VEEVKKEGERGRGRVKKGWEGKGKRREGLMEGELTVVPPKLQLLGPPVFDVSNLYV